MSCFLTYRYRTAWIRIRMDPHSLKNLDPDPQKVNAEPKHCLRHCNYRYSTNNLAFLFTKVSKIKKLF
jgi:hypothetical protein